MERRGIVGALALMGGLAVAVAPAVARDETQLWLVQNATTRLGAGTVLGIDASQRFLDSPRARHQYLARISLTHRATKHLEIGGGFAWTQSGGVNEYRPFAEATLGSGLFASRTRIEPRMFDNADRTVWRLRERAQLSLPLDRAKHWTALLNGEAFFNLNTADVAKDSGLTQVRTLAGIRRSLGERVSLTLSYQRQQTLVRGGEDLITHQPILALAARF